MIMFMFQLNCNDEVMSENSLICKNIINRRMILHANKNKVASTCTNSDICRTNKTKHRFVNRFSPRQCLDTATRALLPNSHLYTLYTLPAAGYLHYVSACFFICVEGFDIAIVLFPFDTGGGY